jgi:ABC-type amino acid transport substrate-binding protein
MTTFAGRFGRLLRRATLAFLLAGPAAAQGLCESYVVQKGDDLNKIAEIAGLEAGYRPIYDANRDVLYDPNIVPIGLTIRIPCADGSLPAEPAKLEPAPTAEAPDAATPAGPLPTIRLLTGGDYAPFTGEDLPGQGMMTEMVTTAIHTARPDQDYRVIFVNDWGAHLTELLPVGAFDMGFPWFLPDCTRLDRLSPANALRCTDYDASDPLFEAKVGFYAMKGGPFQDVTATEELTGARLCRPDGWFTFDLEAEGLVAPAVTMVTGASQRACWEALGKGEVDVVTFDALPAEADLQALGLLDSVVELPGVATFARMHVLTPKSNPNGRAYLDIVNAGLAEMRADGTWFDIVSRHLTLALN